MKTSLYTVNLTDLGTYRIIVAADTPAEAESVAKEVLHEEAFAPADGLIIVKRETDAVAELAPKPVQTYRVRATYKLDFSLTVPANSRDEAARHAKRIYAINYGPFEFDHDGDRVTPFIADADWARDRLDRNPGATMGAAALYADYRIWMEARGRSNALTVTAFGRWMGDLGLARDKVGGRIVYRGIRLRPATRLIAP